MTPSVSTLGSQVLRLFRAQDLSEAGGRGVVGRVVGLGVGPTAPDDPDPGAGQDAYSVGMVAASGEGASIDVGCPRAGVARVVGEGRDRLAEAFVARPSEMHRLVFAGLLGDGGDAGDRGDSVGGVVGLAA